MQADPNVHNKQSETLSKYKKKKRKTLVSFNNKFSLTLFT